MKERLLILTLLLLVAAGPACGRKENSAVEKPAPVKEVRTETAARSSVDDLYEAAGTVRSRTTTTLSSRTVGTVLAVHAREGDRVHRGQLLIEVDERDSQAQLQKARAGLLETQEAIGEVDQNIRAAESAVEAAEAGRNLAATTYKRYKDLLDLRSVSPQEYDEALSRLKVAEAEVTRVVRMLDSVRARKSQVLARIEQARADVSAGQIMTGYGRISSPMAGVVTAKHADVGLLAAPGVPLLSLEDAEHYRLEASVEESMTGRIRVGSAVRVSFDALGGKEWPCRVSEMAPGADPTSRSYLVRIDLPEGTPSLRSGLYGKARFPLGSKSVLTVPQTAILTRGQLTGVYAVDGEGLARFRLVQTGKPVGSRIEILSGLSEGNRIVAEKPEALEDGTKVK
jgi:membrane fusion protein, multidrug efflux system